MNYFKGLVLLFLCLEIINIPGQAQPNSQKIPKNVYNWIKTGDSLIKTNNWDSAKRYYYKASQKLTQKKKWLVYLILQNKILDYLYTQKKYKDGLDLAQKNIQQVFPQLNTHYFEEAKIYFMTGRIYRRLDSLGFVVPFLEKASEVLDNLNLQNDSINIQIEYLWGFMEREQEPQKAFKHFAKAYTVSRLYQEDSELTLALLDHIGLTFYKRGQYHQAIPYFQKTLRERLKLHGSQDIETTFSYTNLGLSFTHLKNFDKAKYFLFNSFNIQTNKYGAEHLQVGKTLENMGVMYRNEGKIDSSLSYFDKALAIYLKNQGELRDMNITKLYLNIGISHYYKAQYDSCIFYYNKTLQGYPRYLKSGKITDASAFLPCVCNNLANIYYEFDQLDTALIYYQQSIHDLLIKPDLPFQFQQCLEFAFNGQASTYYQLWNRYKLNKYYEYAIKYFNLSDSLVEINRQKRHLIGDKIELHPLQEFYKEAIALCLEKNERNLQELAFYFSERSKANLLQEAYRNSEGKIPKELLREKKVLQSKLDFFRQILLGLKDDSLKILYEDSLFFAQMDMDQLLEKIKTSDSFEKTSAILTKTVPEIQSNLDAQTAVISYLSAREKLFVFLITQEDYQVLTLNISQDLLKNYAGDFFKSMNSLSNDFPSQSHQLYQVLLEPLKQWIQTKQKLFIIPDKNLYRIPFDALLTKAVSGHAAVDYQNLPYLIQKYTLSIYPSVSLALGNKDTPANQHYSYDFVGFAPVFTKKGAIVNSQVIEEQASRGFTGNSFDPLPFSEIELKKIDSLFRQLHKHSRVYLSEAAREDSLKSMTINTRVLHFSTHGLADENTPELSRLAFYQPDSVHYYHQLLKGNLGIDDGILFQYELANLDLKVDLLVLGACESGKGKIVSGEGILSLCWGFMYQKVPRIIYSLWKIKDGSTAELMTHFYDHHLRQGYAYPEALRVAKLEMIRNHNYSHPGFWSGVQLMNPF